MHSRGTCISPTCPLSKLPQVLFSLPELAERYANNAHAIFTSAPANPADDLPSQLAKVGVALVQGKTGNPPPLPTAPDATAAAGGAATAATATTAAPGSGPEPMDIVQEAGVAAADAAAAAAADRQQLDAAHAGEGPCCAACHSCAVLRIAGLTRL